MRQIGGDRVDLLFPFRPGSPTAAEQQALCESSGFHLQNLRCFASLRLRRQRDRYQRQNGRERPRMLIEEFRLGEGRNKRELQGRPAMETKQRSGSRTCRGRRTSRSKKRNAATLTPLPMASIAAATKGKPGDFENRRKGVPKILREPFHPRPAPRIARLFA